MNSWQTVWQLAGMRNNTKQGKDHLTQHAFDVLQAFVQNEAREAMAKSVSATVQWIDLSELI